MTLGLLMLACRHPDAVDTDAADTQANPDTCATDDECGDLQICIGECRDGDRNNNKGTAQILAPGEIATGVIFPDQDTDWYVSSGAWDAAR